MLTTKREYQDRFNELNAVGRITEQYTIILDDGTMVSCIDRVHANDLIAWYKFLGSGYCMFNRFGRMVTDVKQKQGERVI